MSRVDWSSTQEAVDLAEKPDEWIEYDEEGNLINNPFYNNKKKEIIDEPEGSEENPTEESEVNENSNNSDNHEDVVSSVSSDHPDMTESEEAFGHWLQTHPVHETEQEWEQLHLGQKKLYTPQFEDEDEEEDSDEDSQSDNSRQQDSESDQSGGKEPDYSYLDELGKK